MSNPTPGSPAWPVATAFRGTSVRTAGVAGSFPWSVPVPQVVGAAPTVTLYSDPGYGTLAVANLVSTGTADPEVWMVSYPARLAAGVYWCEGSVTFYGASSPVAYRGHVLVLAAYPETPPAPWAPQLSDLAVLLPHRTMDDTGTPTGAFSPNTKVTAAIAQAHLDAAVADVRAQVGDVGGRAGTLARRSAVLTAASYVELAYFPDVTESAEDRDMGLITEWRLLALTALNDALGVARSGIIGSPRRPGAPGSCTPGYGPVF